MFSAFSRRLARCGAGAIGGACAVSQRARAESRQSLGGVEDEYKTTPRAIASLDPPRLGFFGKEVKACGIPIRAHAQVSNEALSVAADRLSRMLRNLPEPIVERLLRRGAAFHVIGICQGTSCLPEHSHMKGVDGGYTGEKGITLDMRARGMGGVQSSCGEENLLDLDTDPRYAGRDILTHEFAHCIMDVGLPPALQREIRETHAKAVEKGRRERASSPIAREPRAACGAHTAACAVGRWTRADGSRAYVTRSNLCSAVSHRCIMERVSLQVRGLERVGVLRRADDVVRRRDAANPSAILPSARACVWLPAVPVDCSAPHMQVLRDARRVRRPRRQAAAAGARRPRGPSRDPNHAPHNTA
jgi:hypothetical protein